MQGRFRAAITGTSYSELKEVSAVTDWQQVGCREGAVVCWKMAFETVSLSSGAASAGARVRVTSRIGAGTIVRYFTCLDSEAIEWAGRGIVVEVAAIPITTSQTVLVQGCIWYAPDTGGNSDSYGANLVGSSSLDLTTSAQAIGSLQVFATDVEVSAGTIAAGTATARVLLRRKSDSVWCDTGKTLSLGTTFGAQAVVPGIVPGHFDQVGLALTTGTATATCQAWEILPWE